MTRTVVIIILALIPAAAGNWLAASLKRRADGLKLFLCLLNEAELLIEYKAATVYEIISALSADERFDMFGFIKETERLCGNRSVPFGNAWESAVRNCMPEFFSAADSELIISFGKELGKSGKDGQLNMIKLRQGETKRLFSEADSEYASKARLYRSLGILAGAFLAVLLI